MRKNVKATLITLGMVLIVLMCMFLGPAFTQLMIKLLVGTMLILILWLVVRFSIT